VTGRCHSRCCTPDITGCKIGMQKKKHGPGCFGSGAIHMDSRSENRMAAFTGSARVWECSGAEGRVLPLCGRNTHKTAVRFPAAAVPPYRRMNAFLPLFWAVAVCRVLPYNERGSAGIRRWCRAQVRKGNRLDSERSLLWELWELCLPARCGRRTAPEIMRGSGINEEVFGFRCIDVGGVSCDGRGRDGGGLTLVG